MTPLTAAQKSLVEAHLDEARVTAAATRAWSLTYHERLSTVYLAYCLAAQSYPADCGVSYAGYALAAARNAIRHECRHPRLAFEEFPLGAIPAPSGNSSANEDREFLAWALGQLTSRQRSVLDLILAGCEHKQIGLALGMARKTSERHATDAVKRMRDLCPR